MTPNSTFSERVAVVGTIDPDAYSASGSYDKFTDAVDLGRHERVAFVVMLGAVGAGGTVDFKVQQSDAPGGSYADVAGKAIVQLGEDDDAKQAIVEVRAAELGVSMRYVRGALRTATAGSDAAVAALAIDARCAPASEGNLASVAEVVA